MDHLRRGRDDDSKKIENRTRGLVYQSESFIGNGEKLYYYFPEMLMFLGTSFPKALEINEDVKKPTLCVFRLA